MIPGMTPRRRLAALVGLLAVSFSGIWLWIYRTEVSLPFCRMWAAYQCRSGSVKFNEPTWAFGQLLHSGEAGYRHLARLLTTDEYAVWTRTADVIWDSLSSEETALFVEFLRWDEPEALIFLVMGNPGITDGCQWSAPTEAGLNLCRRFLKEEVAFEGGAIERAECFRRWKLLALNLLGAMLPPGEVGPALPGTSKADDLSSRIVRELSLVASGGGDLELRQTAIENLAVRSSALGPNAEEFHVELSYWERLLSGRADDRWLGEILDAQVPLLALVYVEDPRVFGIVLRIWKRPDSRARVEEVLRLLSEANPLPVHPPSWLPFANAARRHLRGLPAGRRMTALALADVAIEGGAEALREALFVEDDPALSVLYRACLVAYGDAAESEAVIGEFNLRLASAEAPLDLARVLLRAGRRDVLEIVAEKGLVINLREHVEGTPLLFPESSNAVEPYREELSDWWSANKDGIAWDSSRRVFMQAIPRPTGRP